MKKFNPLLFIWYSSRMLEDLSILILSEKLDELRRQKKKLVNELNSLDTDIIEIKIILENKKEKNIFSLYDTFELYDD